MILTLAMLFGLKKGMGYRCDGHPHFKYFFPREYGAKTQPFSFFHKKCLLRGDKIFYEGKPRKGVLIFFHGMGAGHTAYTQEICYFAKLGYLVYSYDFMGCMTSEGKGIGSVCESIASLKDFFRFLDADEDAKGLDRYVVGHSWGGYTALGASINKYKVKKIVSIAGFLDPCATICLMQKRLKKFSLFVRIAMFLWYGRNSLPVGGRVRKSSAKILYVQGDNDTMIPPSFGYEAIKEAMEGDPRLETMLIEGATHNPYWTLRSQKAFIDAIKQYNLASRDFDNSFQLDYKKINEDDPSVMKAMADFLER